MGLGPPPEVDLQRAEELVGITEGASSLVALPTSSFHSSSLTGSPSFNHRPIIPPNAPRLASSISRAAQSKRFDLLPTNLPPLST